MLESKISELVKAEGWGAFEIIHFSAIKKTAVLTILLSDRPVVVKVCFADVKMESSLDFYREMEYYRKLSKCSSVPALLLVGDNYFALEYINGKTLYQNFTSNKQNGLRNISCLATVLLEFNRSTCDTKTKVDADFLTEEITKLVRTLLLCGPKGTKNFLLNHVLLKAVELSFRWIIKKIIRGKVLSLCNDGVPMGERLHGDMHMNNIIEDESGNVFLIDFECAREKPGMLIDALYAYATYQAIYTTTEEDLDIYSYKLFSNYSNNRSLKYLFKLSRLVVASNPRFGMRGSIARLPHLISTIILSA